MDDPQAHRVERILAVTGERVCLETRPVGLEVDAPLRLMLAWDATVERLDSIGD